MTSIVSPVATNSLARPSLDCDIALISDMESRTTQFQDTLRAFALSFALIGTGSVYLARSREPVPVWPRDVEVTQSPLEIASRAAVFGQMDAQPRELALMSAIGDARQDADADLEVGAIDPPDDETWWSAINVLRPIILVSAIPMPLFLPLADGGLGAEWHDGRMNIELRFRSSTRVYCLIEDGEHEVEDSSGFGSSIDRAKAALTVLDNRLASGRRI